MNTRMQSFLSAAARKYPELLCYERPDTAADLHTPARWLDAGLVLFDRRDWLGMTALKQGAYILAELECNRMIRILELTTGRRLIFTEATGAQKQ